MDLPYRQPQASTDIHVRVPSALHKQLLIANLNMSAICRAALIKALAQHAQMQAASRSRADD